MKPSPVPFRSSGALSLTSLARRWAMLGVLVFPVTTSVTGGWAMGGPSVPSARPVASQSRAVGPGEARVITLGDVDDDGDLDAFVLRTAAGDPGERHSLWLNDGRAGFVESGQDFGSAAGLAALLMDIDGDGDLDLLLAQETGAALIVWKNEGAGRFGSGQELDPVPHIRAILGGDVDSDGDDDVIVSGARSAVLVNDGSGKLADSGRRYPVPVTSVSPVISLGDVDGDGSLDLTAESFTEPGGRPCSREVWLNDGTGRFSNHHCALGPRAAVS